MARKILILIYFFPLFLGLISFALGFFLAGWSEAFSCLVLAEISYIIGYIFRAKQLK
ncbi:MAG: hypothetical protein GF365_03255 [Candidatus Buchananbacteria bacterium]|nr:hypothetical protein [Candidatus Buchananbacteria bacterium]